MRERLGVVSDPERARSLVEQAIRAEAKVKNHPPDLINVALEVLVREGVEPDSAGCRSLVLASAWATIRKRTFGLCGWPQPFRSGSDAGDKLDASSPMGE